VPETAVNQNDRTASGKNDVGPARQVPAVDTKPEPPAVQQTADQFFGLRVTAADAGHHAAACGAVYDIDHWLLQKQFAVIIRCQTDQGRMPPASGRPHRTAVIFRDKAQGSLCRLIIATKQFIWRFAG
jgi:hypothetical protein